MKCLHLGLHGPCAGFIYYLFYRLYPHINVVRTRRNRNVVIKIVIYVLLKFFCMCIFQRLSLITADTTLTGDYQPRRSRAKSSVALESSPSMVVSSISTPKLGLVSYHRVSERPILKKKNRPKRTACKDFASMPLEEALLDDAFAPKRLNPFLGYGIEAVDDSRKPSCYGCGRIRISPEIHGGEHTPSVGRGVRKAP